MLKKGQFALLTLIGGFLVHLNIGTFQVRSEGVNLHLFSYLDEVSYLKYTKNQFDMIFSISSAINIIFRLIGVLLKGHYNTILITGIGLLIHLISKTFINIFPDFRIFTILIFLSGVGCGLAFMPIILDIWKYFPNSKALCASFVLSGFGLTRLIYRYITILMVNPGKTSLKPGTYKYPKEINESLLIYLKFHLFFLQY